MVEHNYDSDASRMIELAERLYAVLRDFPSNGQLRSLDDGTLTDLLLAGFIERHEITKPCRTCGTIPTFDYGYFKVTSGGKLFLEAMNARATQGEEQ